MRMKEEGKGSKAPLTDSFLRYPNNKTMGTKRKGQPDKKHAPRKRQVCTPNLRPPRGCLPGCARVNCPVRHASN